MKISALQTVFLLGILSISQSSMAANGTSYELMCRNKAKEIAAETYNGCINDNKQSQLKEVRNEYQQELAAIKKRFETKLKKISKGELVEKENNKSANNGYIKRSSGARELPENVATSIKDTAKDQSKADLSNDTDASSVEIVEIPAEQE